MKELAVAAARFKWLDVAGLVGWLLTCYVAAGVAASSTIEAQDFYVRLHRPAWAPPGWVFGPVWVTLYTMMGVAAWIVWRQRGLQGGDRLLGLFLVQLSANGLWSWLFFAWRLGAVSTIEIALLWMLILATIVGFWRVKPLAGALLVPYLGWVTFAAVLCFQIWRMNRGLL